MTLFSELYGPHYKGEFLKKFIFLGVLFISVPLPLLAETAVRTVPFDEIWNLVKKNSPSLRAKDYDLKASQIAENRAGNHWFPRVYLDGRVFETNDPSLSFMSVLEQRQIGPADFAPQALNQPLDKLYARGTLGVDFPLFEGGGKQSLADSARKSREVKELEKDAETTNQYVQLADSYAMLLVLADEKENLDKLKLNVEEILKGYKIGSKSNPVGYSGLLGLKNLENRLEGLQAQNQARQNILKSQMGIQTQSLTGDWIPIPGKAKDFLDQVFPSTDKPQDPDFVLEAQANADLLEKMKGVETAKLLPKVALFGEGYFNGGDRSTATGYTAGAYLQWDILNIPNMGAGEQAADSWEAAKARAKEIRLKSELDSVQSSESLRSLNTNLDLMNESAKLLEEQTETAKNLFKNGSINALQLAEVLARRADLITNRTQTEMDLVQARTILAVNSGFKEPSIDLQ